MISESIITKIKFTGSDRDIPVLNEGSRNRVSAKNALS